LAVTIATWNVNSILARLPTALAVLQEVNADVVCLQELKCEDARFPRLEIEALGYHVETLGQKTYNGVAILTKLRVEEVRRGLPGMAEDPQARYLEVVLAAPSGPIRVASIYAPNGNPVDSEKYPYKLQFLDCLHRHAVELLAYEEPLILAGDYNIIPGPDDCHDPKAWEGDALFRPETRAAWRRLIYLGLTDAFAQADGRAHSYSFWDYQAGAWPKDHGIRIDHLLLSAQAGDRLESARIHRAARGMEKPSDHVPVLGVFTL
jgi:exodeoxyribonuclease-3